MNGDERWWMMNDAEWWSTTMINDVPIIAVFVPIIAVLVPHHCSTRAHHCSTRAHHCTHAHMHTCTHALGIENPPKIHQKSIQKVIKNKMQFWMQLGRLLGRFLVDFGSNLGGKLEPSWHQNLKNGGPKTMSKNELWNMCARSRNIVQPMGGGSL